MHILMYRWKAYNYRDIEQTFRLLGHTVDNIEQELGNYDIDPDFEAEIEALMEKKFGLPAVSANILRKKFLTADKQLFV